MADSKGAGASVSALTTKALDALAAEDWLRQMMTTFGGT